MQRNNLDISNIQIEIGPKIYNKLVYLRTQNIDEAEKLQIVPFVLIKNNNTIDITLKQIKFKIMNLDTIIFDYHDSVIKSNGGEKLAILRKSPTLREYVIDKNLSIPLSIRNDIFLKSAAFKDKPKFKLSDILERTIKIRQSIDNPSNALFNLSFKEISETKSIDIGLTPFPGFKFWGKITDLKENEIWELNYRSHHDNVQAFAYDCGIYRYDENLQSKWTELNEELEDIDIRKENYLIWERPVYSMTDGMIELIRSHSMDVEPNIYYETHPQDPKPSPEIRGPANEVIIKTDDNLFIQYSHLRKDSIPSELKINSKIHAGDLLGLVGNSGRTSGPHIHVHIITITPPGILSLKSLKKVNDPIPLSIKEKFYRYTKSSKLRILAAKESLQYFWPIPLPFKNCLIAKRSNTDFSETTWFPLDDRGPALNKSLLDETIVWPNSSPP